MEGAQLLPPPQEDVIVQRHLYNPLVVMSCNVAQQAQSACEQLEEQPQEYNNQPWSMW